MTNAIPEVLTPEEAAERTKTNVVDVMNEIETGRLPAFRVGDHWRVTVTSLCEFMAGAQGNGRELPRFSLPGGTSGSAGVQWKRREPFTYMWPDGKTEEKYDEAYEANVQLPSGRRPFVIGYTYRLAAGMDRRRIIVFVGEVPRVHPLVEFTGTNEYASNRQVASVIKNPDNKHVRSQAQLPPEYSDMRTAIYSDVVQGPYAARSMAVIAGDEDRDVMLRHALIRARYKLLITD